MSEPAPHQIVRSVALALPEADAWEGKAPKRLLAMRSAHGGHPTG